MQSNASGICECDAVVVYSRLSSAPVDLEEKINNKRREGIIMVAVVVVVVVLRW